MASTRASFLEFSAGQNSASPSRAASLRRRLARLLLYGVVAVSNQTAAQDAGGGNEPNCLAEGGLSKEDTAWCCLRRSIGCTRTEIVQSPKTSCPPRYPCRDLLGASEDEKLWCCRTKRFGCCLVEGACTKRDPAMPPVLECHGNDTHNWSKARRVACCASANKDCPPFSCEEYKADECAGCSLADQQRCELERDVRCCIHDLMGQHGGDNSGSSQVGGETPRDKCCKQASPAVQESQVCRGSQAVKTNCTGDELDRVKCCTYMGLGGSEVCCQQASLETQDTRYCRAALGKVPNL